MSLLEVENLHTHFITRDLGNRIRVATALNGVSFAVGEGEVVGIVGETGAGKSLTAMSVIGLLPPAAKVVAGTARFAGDDLLAMSPATLNRLRGDQITLIVQSPKTSLDPLKRIGDQLVRIQKAHRAVSDDEARRNAVEMLATVGIPDPEQRARAWPHELSGGMAQRVLIAMALVNGPRLLIADEPTTGLDVTVQAQILDLLMELVQARRLAAMIITHDLGIVAHYCHRMAVMFAGRIVEQGKVADIFKRPAHPYTKALIASTPKQIAARGYAKVGGLPPNLYALPSGCHYRDRCPEAEAACTTEPPLVTVRDGQRALCHVVARGTRVQ
ncbi:MAG: ABC transporter ATP-binding protein [Alphaproteobacteria bacterium]|nr:ABC transporter ATP-binding protein [Alphaproteobacteria bacterium]